MAMAGRPPGQVKTGGRVKGTLNKEQRKEITDEIAHDILAVYRGLGGVSFLLDFAKAQPTEFVRQCLARLMPPMPRDDPESVNQSLTINASNMTDFEAARRIAYALAKGLNSQMAERVLTPQEACRLEPRRQHPDDIPAPTNVRLPNEELAALVRAQEAKEWQQVTLETYSGSSAEQGIRRRELL